MMKPFILILLTALLFSACDDKLPKDILPPPAMKNIMWDMIVAEQLNKMDTSKESKLHIKDSTTSRYNEILLLHKTSYKIYVNSLKYYEAHPDDFKEIFDSLSTYGTRLNDSLMPKEKNNPKKNLNKNLLINDSILIKIKGEANKLKSNLLRKKFEENENKNLNSQ